jgi:hypothetical protein
MKTPIRSRLCLDIESSGRCARTRSGRWDLTNIATSFIPDFALYLSNGPSPRDRAPRMPAAPPSQGCAPDDLRVCAVAPGLTLASMVASS